MKDRITEVWMTPIGELQLIEWNLCGCCPSTVTRTWGKAWKEAGYYGYKNKSAFTRGLNKRGWERIEVRRWDV